MLRPKIRHVERVISRRRLARIAGIVLLVHDDDAEVFQRRKYGAPRADGDFRLPRTHSPPFVELLPRRQAAVHDRRVPTEPRAELGQHLRRQRNFGNQKYRAFALFQALRDQREVNFRLAAPRHAVQELDRPSVRLYLLHRRPLVRGEDVLGRSALHALIRVAENLLLGDGYVAFLFERRHAARKQAVQKSAFRLSVLCEVFRRTELVFRRPRKFHFRERDEERGVILFELPHLPRAHFRGQKQP